MSQRQEERREQAQADLHAELAEESHPFREQIRALESEGGQEDKIGELQKQINAIYAPHEAFLTKP